MFLCVCNFSSVQWLVSYASSWTYRMLANLIETIKTKSRMSHILWKQCNAMNPIHVGASPKWRLGEPDVPKRICVLQAYQITFFNPTTVHIAQSVMATSVPSKANAQCVLAWGSMCHASVLVRDDWWCDIFWSNVVEGWLIVRIGQVDDNNGHDGRNVNTITISLLMYDKNFAINDGIFEWDDNEQDKYNQTYEIS